MTIGFTINTGTYTGADLDDLYVRSEYFSQGGQWGWGYNVNGQLADNTATGKSSPVQTVAGGTIWKQVSHSYWNCAAVKTDGTLWTWGRNTYGELGNNTAAVTVSSPVQTVAGGSNWKQVSCGGKGGIAAIKTDGTLWLWGYNTFGDIGDNTVATKSSPVQTVTGGNNWLQVSCGYGVGAIKTDGTLWMWGRNTYGYLGDNTVVPKSSPVQTVAGGNNWKSISIRGATSAVLAIKTDGTLWAWGRNNAGQLGDNTIVHKSSPVQTVAGGTNWKQASSNWTHSAAVKTDGTLWTWGTNSNGQLGDNTLVAKSSPIQTITGGNNWKMVACGYYHTVAIKNDGTLWTWGRNTLGELGTNSTTGVSSPVQTVMGGTNWKTIDAGQSTFAITII